MTAPCEFPSCEATLSSDQNGEGWSTGTFSRWTPDPTDAWNAPVIEFHVCPAHRGYQPPPLVEPASHWDSHWGSPPEWVIEERRR